VTTEHLIRDLGNIWYQHQLFIIIWDWWQRTMFSCQSWTLDAFFSIEDDYSIVAFKNWPE